MPARQHLRLITQHMTHSATSISCAFTLCLALHSSGLAQPSMPSQSAPTQAATSKAPQRQQVQQTQQLQRIQQGPKRLRSRQSFGEQSSALQGKSLEDLVNALPRREAQVYDAPQIQIAILLDVSGSMNGLINQARAELWKVVNAFNGATQDGKEPEVRVALYSYGTSQVDQYGLFLNPLIPLTTDLDRISEVLFALKTSGSSEYCGASILAAAKGQAWSSASSDLKAIMIAGNESFRQGPIPPQRAFKEAGARGILTHTIHCGDPHQGIRDHWRAGATEGEGQFMNINHNAKEEYIPTPFDDQLEALNAQLNETYLPYGTYGARGKANQIAQDANAASLSKASSLSRAQTKSGRYYNNARWDLVDAYDRKTLKINQLSTDALPKEMQSMSQTERLDYVKSFLNRRKEVQKRIAQLNLKRTSFLNKARAEKSGGDQRIDSAMIKALKDQARALGFIWPAQK